MPRARKQPTDKMLPLTTVADIEAIIAGNHSDPFAVLGLQEERGRFIARCFVPHAEAVIAFTLAGEELGELARRDEAGCVDGVLRLDRRQPLRLKAGNADGEWWITDPYSFGPVLGPMED